MTFKDVEKLLNSYITNKALISNLKLLLEDGEPEQVENTQQQIIKLEKEVLLLENGLTTLTSEEYKVLDLKYFKREKGHVIADKLGISECNVYKRINKAKERLQKVMN